MFTELLAESEFPAQGVLFIIVMIFSFLKWLFDKLTSKKEGGEPGTLESLYDQYREDIVQRQTQVTPPPIQPVRAERPRVSASPPAIQRPASKPKFSSVDIEKARISKIKKSQQSANDSSIKAKGDSDNTAIRKKLRSKDGLRQAIIARQILGPPKAFTGQKF